MHKRLWRVRIDPKRPHQCKAWYDGKKLKGIYSVCLHHSSSGHPMVTFKLYGGHCEVDWLTEEESDALSTESQEQETGTGKEGR